MKPDHPGECQALAQLTTGEQTWPVPPPRAAATSRAPQPAPPQEADFAEAAETFALLAAPTRVRLLWLLAQGEHDVTSLAETVGATVATVSQHLAKLRLADLVTAHPDGRRQIYRIDDPHIIRLVDQAVEHHAALRTHAEAP